MEDVIKDLLARVEALEASVNSTPRRTQVLRDAKTITTRNDKLMVFLNIKHAGEYLDLIVSGHSAQAASALCAGDTIEYSLPKIERKPAIKNGEPVMSMKTGEQVVNVSGFAENFSIVGAAPAPVAVSKPRVDETGAPRRAKPSAKPAPTPDLGDEDAPF